MLIVTIALLLVAIHTSTSQEVQDDFGRAVEIFRVLKPREMMCLHDSGFSVVLLKAYESNKFLNKAVTNAWMARFSNMSYEVYMIPDPNSKKSALQQLGEVVFGLSYEGLSDFRRIWIKVTNPKNWSLNSGVNVNFLKSLFEAARMHTRKIGIISNRKDFNEITGGVNLGGADVKLWDIAAKGCDEKLATLNNFVTYGGWTKVDAKQYCSAAQTCSTTIQKSVVSTSSFSIKK